MAATPSTPIPPAAPAELSEDELATRLRIAIIRLYRRLRQQSLAGISPAQASALGSVNRLGTPTLGELAAVEQVQPPTMSKLAAQLEEAGLLTRVTDTVDRRVVRVKLTPLGRKSVERIRRLERDYLASQLASLEAGEQEAAADLVALLEHLLGPPPAHPAARPAKGPRP
jgi:DNA-binding MarR family transcriptional regulator